MAILFFHLTNVRTKDTGNGIRITAMYTIFTELAYGIVPVKLERLHFTKIKHAHF